MTAPQQPNNTEKTEQANKDKFKHGLAYVPLMAVVLFFIEEHKTPELKKHISYGMILLFGYLVFSAILSILWIGFGWFFGFIYLGVSAYLWYMAYHGKDVHIEQFEEIDKQIQKNMK